MRPAAPGHRAARPCGDARGLVAARAHGACSSGCAGLALPTAPLRAAGSSRSPLTLQGATHARVPQSPSPSPSQASPFPALPPPHPDTVCVCWCGEGCGGGGEALRVQNNADFYLAF